MAKVVVEEFKKIISDNWSDVTPLEKIGSGAYGVVFRCEKKAEGTDFSTYEAIKVVKIPFDYEDDFDEESGMTPEEYYTSIKNRAVEEIKIMDQLKGPHIVHINEYKVVNQTEQFGFYILIRMDLYKNLKDILREHVNDTPEKAEKLARKVGEDMCTALDTCFRRDMVHRDIKPENIMVSEDGDFYLGDFGLARQLSSRTRNVSSRGTEAFMAPEVYTEGCNQLTDLYSLGIVLYKIVNHNKTLFYDPSNNAEALDIAQSLRLSGNVPIPLPDNCSEDFGRIIVKMCAYKPEERFQSIEEIRNALAAKNVGTHNPAVFDKTDSHDSSDQDEQKSSIGEDETFTRTNYTQINNQKINVNNVLYANSETTTAVVAGGGRSSFDWKKALKIIIPVASVVFIVLCICFFTLLNRVVSNVSSGKNTEDRQNSISENDEAGPAEIADETVSEDKSLNNQVIEDNSETQKFSPNENTALSIKLSSMEIVERNHNTKTGFEDSLMDTLGNKYNNALCIGYFSGPSYAKFYLGGKYKVFKGNFSCGDESYNGDFRLDIYGDDINDPIYTLEYTRSLPVTPLELDVTGVEFITFKISADDSLYYNGIISDGVFFASENDSTEVPGGMEEVVQDTKITSMKIVERNHNTKTGFEDSLTDTLGNKYNNALCIGYFSGPSYAKFYLGGKYKVFKGNFSCGDESYNGDFRLDIYGDDINDPIYTLEYTRSIPVTPLELDVTGVEFITFKISADDSLYYDGIISEGMFYI